MRERPILFNGEMVRAILGGQKTQTRRAVSGVRGDNCLSLRKPTKTRSGIVTHVLDAPERGLCPFGQPGDRLWVRETWQHYDWTEDGEPCIRYQADGATEWPEDYSEQEGLRLNDVWVGLSDDANFAIDGRAADRRWRPSIHMPRWACRLVLEITAVRVERLQAISEADAIKEGLSQSDTGSWLPGPCDHPEWAFHQLWAQVYGEPSWEANPWVWVIEFKRVEAA